MTNQRRSLRNVLLSIEAGEPSRARILEAAFWRPSSTWPRPEGAAVVDLAARRRPLA